MWENISLRMLQFISYLFRLVYSWGISLNTKQKSETKSKTTGSIYAPPEHMRSENRLQTQRGAPITSTALKSNNAATFQVHKKYWFGYFGFYLYILQKQQFQLNEESMACLLRGKWKPEHFKASVFWSHTWKLSEKSPFTTQLTHFCSRDFQW